MCIYATQIAVSVTTNDDLLTYNLKAFRCAWNHVFFRRITRIGTDWSKCQHYTIYTTTLTHLLLVLQTLLSVFIVGIHRYNRPWCVYNRSASVGAGACQWNCLSMLVNTRLSYALSVSPLVMQRGVGYGGIGWRHWLCSWCWCDGAVQLSKIAVHRC